MKIIPETKKSSLYSFLAKNSFVLFLFSYLLLLLIGPLFQRGDFIDAMLYKTVAFNYAEGISSFWSMKYTNTSMQFFCEQPPLYFFLLSVFYKCFGVNFIVDRLFTFILFIAFLYILKITTELLFNKQSSYLQLTLFFLFSIQVLCWSFVNQVIESMVIVLICLEILLFILYLKKSRIVYMLLFSLVLVLLFLTKGFQSCFIVLLPLIYTLLSRFKRNTFYFSGFVVFSFLAAIATFLFLYAPSKLWYDCYYQTRIVLTLQNVGATTTEHSEILFRFIFETVVTMIFIIGLCLYVFRVRKYPIRLMCRRFFSNKLAVSLFICALAGSLPYALSLVQRGFYLVPSFLCFILSIILGWKAYWLYLFRSWNRVTQNKFVLYIIMVITILSITAGIVSQGYFKREAELGHDIKRIVPFLKQHETVLIQSNMWNYFNLHSYLYMERQVSLSTEDKKSHFMITFKDEILNDKSLMAKKIDLELDELQLYYLEGR